MAQQPLPNLPPVGDDDFSDDEAGTSPTAVAAARAQAQQAALGAVAAPPLQEQAAVTQVDADSDVAMTTASQTTSQAPSQLPSAHPTAGGRSMDIEDIDTHFSPAQASLDAIVAATTAMAQAPWSEMSGTSLDPRYMGLAQRQQASPLRCHPLSRLRVLWVGRLAPRLSL